MSEVRDCWAVVVAAGSGSRMGEGIPKQFRMLAGRSVLAWSLEALRAVPRIAGIAVVLPPGVDLAEAGIAPADDLIAVAGGAERMDSVAAGLAALRAVGADDTARVLVHDGARPCVRADSLPRLLDAANGPGGALLALPMSDTVKRADGEGVAPLHMACSEHEIACVRLLIAHGADVNLAAKSPAARKASARVEGDSDEKTSTGVERRCSSRRTARGRVFLDVRRGENSPRPRTSRTGRDASAISACIVRTPGCLALTYFYGSSGFFISRPPRHLVGRSAPAALRPCAQPRRSAPP